MTSPLVPGQCLKLRAEPGHGILCRAGTVWITLENDRRDIFLKAGEDFTFTCRGVALITAEQASAAVIALTPPV
jgi:hypothetical protein